jgi:hypothetical protein
MKAINTTVAALRGMTPAQIQALAKASDHPEFVARMLKEVTAGPKIRTDTNSHIQWSWSYKSRV